PGKSMHQPDKPSAGHRRTMKNLQTPRRAAWKLGLAASLFPLLTVLAGNGGNGLIVNETFDPPTIPLSGWEGNVSDVVRQYVPDGVKGTTAAQISANLQDSGAYIGTMLYQNLLVFGNRRATTAGTSLSIDLKVDRPDLVYVVVGLQSWGGFAYNYLLPALPVTASVGVVPVGKYTPGKFKTITVPLDNPLWVLDDTFPGPLNGPFDPSGRTYQIFVSVDSGSLPALGAFTLTIDNIQVVTKNPMVPWALTSSGQASFETDGSLVVTEAGTSSHLGKYTSKAVFHPDLTGLGLGNVVITAANGDQLLGLMYVSDDYTYVVVGIDDGTGRFKGAAGDYLGLLTWTDMSFSSTGSGSLSTVGSNK
ncbi:MAG TPA: hypothetical protein VHI52_17730, partial [Verrucomicrobiae bacterium]|nr:hypothetical protein [Verrucomicrobiae bacterium]